jgi:hypothetical protein
MEGKRRPFFITSLRRHLPKSVEIGRGFIVAQHGVSRQIDVLIYSADAPVLFKDGDLVFVTADAVLGIIEVKTSLPSIHKLRAAARQLIANAQWASRGAENVKFFGLFAYDSAITAEAALKVLGAVAAGDPGRVIDLCCLGEKDFVRWSKIDRHNPVSQHGIWRAYQRLEGKAYGYFLHNVIQLLAPKSVGKNLAVWFPPEGKDEALVGELPFEPRKEFRIL